MCHGLFSLLCSFHLRYVEAGDVSRSLQDLGKTWTGSPRVPGHEFFDVEAGFAQDFDNKFVVLLPHTLDCEDRSLADFVGPAMCNPFGRALVYCDALQGFYGICELIRGYCAFNLDKGPVFFMRFV